jgi:hypothetical protein
MTLQEPQISPNWVEIVMLLQFAQVLINQEPVDEFDEYGMVEQGEERAFSQSILAVGSKIR